MRAKRSEVGTVRSKQPTAIAIDGPVASGKTAVGRLVSQRLSYRFVDTGLMYRAVTWLALERKLDLNDQESLAYLAHGMRISIDSNRILIDGVDVTDRLRSSEVGENVSLVSRVPGVRAAMVQRQRELAMQGSIVMAGRDIGTVVLPDAELKIYLDASVDERVRRRHDELAAGGTTASPNDVRDELAMRDAIDSSRNVSPLRPAEDAIVIGTDQLSLDDVVRRILELAGC